MKYKMSVIACFAYTAADCSFQVEYASVSKTWSVCSLMHFKHRLQVVCAEEMSKCIRVVKRRETLVSAASDMVLKFLELGFSCRSSPGAD